MLDVELVEALHGLGLDAASRAALPLLPATYRAWALGPLSAEDRSMVAELSQHGLGMPGAASRRLVDWLAHPPDPARKDRACAVLVELYLRMGEPRMDLCEVCRAIARTQSPLLGPLEEPEREALEGLLQSIGVDPLEDFSATGKLLQEQSTDAAMMEWLDDEHTMPGIPADATGVRHVPPLAGPPGVAMGDGHAEESCARWRRSCSSVAAGSAGSNSRTTARPRGGTASSPGPGRGRSRSGTSAPATGRS